MQKKVIHTDNAPAAVGPYSQAIQLGNMLYTSGQIGLDPTSGKMVAGGVAEQATQVMHNLTAVLAAAGTEFDNVVKTTIFLNDMNDFATVNQVYATFFKAAPPARSTVAVAALPLGALVEIEMVAFIP